MKVDDMDELVFLWNDYGKARNKTLTNSAKDLKKQVRKFVQSLPTFQELPTFTPKKGSGDDE